MAIAWAGRCAQGFFFDLSTKQNIKCPYIPVECKNYSSDLKNPELDQLLGRLSDKRGNFGVLVCRLNENRELILKRCQDAVNDNRRYIVVLDDTNIIDLLKLRAERDYAKISDYMDDQFRQLVM